MIRSRFEAGLGRSNWRLRMRRGEAQKHDYNQAKSHYRKSGKAKLGPYATYFSRLPHLGNSPGEQEQSRLLVHRSRMFARYEP